MIAVRSEEIMYEKFIILIDNCFLWRNANPEIRHQRSTV